MPQPKSSRTTKAAGSRKSAGARKPAARKPAAKQAAKKPAARKPAAKKAPAASARAAQSKRDDALRSNLAQLRDLLSDGVVLTARRVQEALDEAVRGGHMTRRSAEDLARELLDAGRKQTEDVVAGLEQLVGRGRPDLSAVSSVMREGSDRVMREADRVRRTAGIGPSFPVLGYDDLTAAQVQSRLGDLNSAQLRKVRDHERRNANRKSVLAAIEKALK